METATNQIPFTRPLIDYGEYSAVSAVMASGWIASGERVRRFESEFAALIGRDYALSCHSGAAALELALFALGVGPGDEVIVPSLTFTATAAVVRYLGAQVVFADVESAETLTLSPTSVAEAFTPKTKAVIVMSHGGYGGSLPDVAKVCSDAAIPLIEDACHAPGAICRGQRVGTFGRLSAFSFHTTKNITTAEGGMVLFDDPHLSSPLQEYRSHGVRRVPEMRPDGADYVVERIGHNHRMPDLNAALGLAQLERLSAINNERRSLSRRYDSFLGANADLILCGRDERDDGVGHLYTIVLPEDTDRRSLRLALREQGIETAVHFVPLHNEPAYQTGARAVSLRITEQIAGRLLSLPLYPGMTESDQMRVVDALCDALNRQIQSAAPVREASLS